MGGTGRKVVKQYGGAAAKFPCAHLDDRSLKCWGQNSYGNLGYGDTTDRGVGGLWGRQMGDYLPTVELGIGSDLVLLALGEGYTCAASSGGAKCWGRNDCGQLGYGDTVLRGNEPGEMGDNLP